MTFPKDTGPQQQTSLTAFCKELNRVTPTNTLTSPNNKSGTWLISHGTHCSKRSWRTGHWTSSVLFTQKQDPDRGDGTYTPSPGATLTASRPPKADLSEIHPNRFLESWGDRITGPLTISHTLQFSSQNRSTTWLTTRHQSRPNTSSKSWG